MSLLSGAVRCIEYRGIQTLSIQIAKKYLTGFKGYGKIRV